jgi:hypothetical protein
MPLGALGEQPIAQSLGAALHIEAAGKHAVVRHAALDAVVHDRPQSEQAGTHLVGTPQR